MKRFLFLLGIFGMTLLCVDAAKAGPVSVTLTAKFDTTTETSPDVMQFVTTTIRITQKDLVTLFHTLHGFPLDGAKLDFKYGVGFAVVDSDGATLHSIDSGEMAFVAIGPMARSGTYGQPKSSRRSEQNAQFEFVTPTRTFTLTGITRQSISTVFLDLSAFSFDFTGTGYGVLDGKGCVVAGRIKAKH